MIAARYDTNIQIGTTTYVADTTTHVSATTSEPIKCKEPKSSVIENEADRFELSADYKRFISLRRDYDDIRQQFDVDNLTKDEYLKMCKMIKDNGGYNSLTAEEYAWGQSYVDNWYHPAGGSYIELPQKDYDRLTAMAAKHPDPFRFGRILDFATKRRDEGNPISFEQMLELADPSKTPNWIDEDNYVSDIKLDSSNSTFDFSGSDKKYDWMDVITDRMKAVENLPHIKPEDKASFKNASMKMLDILDKIKNSGIKN